MHDPSDLTIAEAADDIAAGRLSPIELTQACLAQIERLNGSIKAFVVVDEEGALEQAAALTAELSTRPRGSLHGIPIAIKDIIDVAGLSTEAGSRILAGNVAAHDAAVVRTLRAAGAVILGKTATQEFAYGVVTPPTRNPWDPSRIPGGSSGGSAAAIAAAMCPGALGTDTAGSIRIPASLCGICGLKPRPGTVAMDGIFPLAPSLDICGPMARTAEDVALMWAALTDAHPEKDDRPLRIGAVASIGDATGASGEVVRLVESAVDDLETAGAQRVPVDIPPVAEWYPARAPLLMREALEVHRGMGWWPDRAGDYTAETANNLRHSERLSPDEIERCRVEVKRLVAWLLDALRDADVIALPSTPVTAPTVAEAALRDGGRRSPVVRSLTSICGPVNVARLAAVAVPCGMADSGLPVGLQLIGSDEDTVLAAALLYQSITDWHTRRPPTVGAEGGDGDG